MTGPFRALFERRSVGSADVLAMLLRGARGVSGQSVTEDSALRVAAVTTCVSLISRTVASLPLGVYERIDERSKRPIQKHWLARVLTRPNPWQSRYDFLETMQLYLLLHRNAYAWINWTRTRNGREAAQLIPLHPARVHVEHRDLFLPPAYVLETRDGRRMPLAADELLHLKRLSTNGVTGRPGLADATDVIGLAQATVEHAGTFWSKGAAPSVLLKHPKTLSPQAKKNLQESFEGYGGGREQSRVAVIEEGMEATVVNVDHEATQFLETRQMSRAEIAAWFHVPGFMAGLEEKQTSWGTGIEQQQIGFMSFTIRPDLVIWEQQIQRQLLAADPSVFAEFKLEGMLRGDSRTRAEFYRTMRQIGAMSANEVRALENMDPREGGDEFDDAGARPVGRPVGTGE